MANTITQLPAGSKVFTAYTSTARTATPDTVEFETSGARGLHLVVDVTAITSTPSVTVTISGVDRASGKVYTVLASAAIATVSTTVLKVGPGLTAAANSVANDLLPPIFRITVTHGNANSITYTIGGLLCG